MHPSKPIIAFIQICFFSAAINTALADRQSLVSIHMQAESFLLEYPYETPYPARFELSTLDQRLKLKPCDQSLDIRFTRAEKIMGNTSLTLRCHSPVNWQIHLPVRVDIYQDVVVNKTPLVRGQIIDDTNLQFRKENISLLFQGFFRRNDALQRLQAKRNLPANSILNPANLSPRKLVTSGQRVTILLKLKGLQVKSTGLALQSATRGQVIKVRNTQTNKIIEGVVSAEGQITVRL